MRFQFQCGRIVVIASVIAVTSTASGCSDAGSGASAPTSSASPSESSAAPPPASSASADESPAISPSRGDAAAPAAGPCVDPAAPVMAFTGANLGPDFTASYQAFDLGTPPGVPNAPGQSLGAIYVKASEPNALYVVGESETPNAALYRLEVKRDACNHIAAYVGNAVKLVGIPNADASLVASPLGWLYTLWGTKLGHAPLVGAPVESNLATIGMPGPYHWHPNDVYPGETATGMSVVPTSFANQGEIVVTTYPSGSFFHVSLTTSGGVMTASALDKRTSIPNGPGGFAYVPRGSPGFPVASLIVTEWFQDTAWKSSYDSPPPGVPQAIAVYEVDDRGDPKPGTRRPFFTQFPRPWGAFFDPASGDFLFATWRGEESSFADRVVQVRGFAVPPAPPAPK